MSLFDGKYRTGLELLEEYGKYVLVIFIIILIGGLFL